LTAKIQHDSKSEAEQVILIIQTYTRITCNSYAKTSPYAAERFFVSASAFCTFLGANKACTHKNGLYTVIGSNRIQQFKGTAQVHLMFL